VPREEKPPAGPGRFSRGSSAQPQEQLLQVRLGIDSWRAIAWIGTGSPATTTPATPAPSPRTSLEVIFTGGSRAGVGFPRGRKLPRQLVHRFSRAITWSVRHLIAFPSGSGVRPRRSGRCIHVPLPVHDPPRDPHTVELGGTSRFTTEPDPILEFSPIRIAPRMAGPGAYITLSRWWGAASPCSSSFRPASRVVEGDVLPISEVSPITTPSRGR